MNDPWRHRSENMSCKTCMYFVGKPITHDPNEDPQIGRCRRHAPTMGGFPVVYRSDWCGDHKLDEARGETE
jgi:hypothetical protein